MYLATLALRSVFQRPPEFFFNAMEAIARKDTTKAPVSEDVYVSYLNLVDHADQVAKLPETLPLVLLMTECLKASGYLDQSGDFPEADVFSGARRNKKAFFAYLIFEFYAVIRANNHSVSGKVEKTLPTGAPARLS